MSLTLSISGARYNRAEPRMMEWSMWMGMWSGCGGDSSCTPVYRLPSLHGVWYVISPQDSLCHKTADARCAEKLDRGGLIMTVRSSAWPMTDTHNGTTVTQAGGCMSLCQQVSKTSKSSSMPGFQDSSKLPYFVICYRTCVPTP